MTAQSPVTVGQNHPALSKAESIARELNAALFQVEEIRIRRLLQELLPIRVQTIEVFGERVLNTSRTLTSAVTELSVKLSGLNAAELISRAVAQTSPTAGLFERFKAKVLQAPVSGAQVDELFGKMVDMLKAVRETEPDCKAAELRISLHVVALATIGAMLGKGESAELHRALDNRKALMLNAHNQALLVGGQLKALQHTITTFRDQCEQVTKVLLTTNKLVDSMR